MSDATAFTSQNSFEQRNFLAVARYLAGRLCGNADTTQVRASGGEGLDGQDTENTAMVTGCKPEPATYLAELLGRYAHQKWVLVFSSAPKGNERLFVLSFSALDPEEVVGRLHKHGLAEATVIAQGQGVCVYIWPKDHSQDAQIRALAEDGNGTVQELAGKGALIGDDDRTKAQRIFDGKLSTYECPNHRAFSRLLWTRKLHDMNIPASAP